MKWACCLTKDILELGPLKASGLLTTTLRNNECSQSYYLIVMRPSSTILSEGTGSL